MPPPPPPPPPLLLAAGARPVLVPWLSPAAAAGALGSLGGAGLGADGGKREKKAPEDQGIKVSGGQVQGKTQSAIQETSLGKRARGRMED